MPSFLKKKVARIQWGALIMLSPLAPVGVVMGFSKEYWITILLLYTTISLICGFLLFLHGLIEGDQ